jgi:hypothetical protein
MMVRSAYTCLKNHRVCDSCSLICLDQRYLCKIKAGFQLVIVPGASYQGELFAILSG